MSVGLRLNFVLLLYLVLQRLLGVFADDGSNTTATTDALKLELINITFYDHSQEKSQTGSVSGYFHQYEEVKRTIHELSKKHVDWCGFALRIDVDGITKFWSPEERKEFQVMLKDFSCSERALRGLYGKERPKQPIYVPVYALSTHIIVLLSAAFSNLLIILLIMAIAFMLKRCCKATAGSADSPIGERASSTGVYPSTPSRVAVETDRSSRGSDRVQEVPSGPDRKSLRIAAADTIVHKSILKI